MNDKTEQPRMRTEFFVEVPPVQGASLGRWLSCAAVVSEVGAGGVTICAHANRVFRLADLATFVCEWMQAHAVEAGLATCDGALLSITPVTNEAGR
jgi:hypothetical protein